MNGKYQMSIEFLFEISSEHCSIPWSNVDFEYSSSWGPRTRKFDSNNAMLSGLQWPMETESATFSINVISSSTVNNEKRIKNH